MEKLTTQKKVKVMIVDDSSVIRLLLEKMFSDEQGIEIVSQVANGKEAYDNLKNVNPDIILLDLEMPVMDGLEFLGKKPKDFLPKVIIFTSSYYKILEARKLGAHAIIKKPNSDSPDAIMAEKKWICEMIYRVNSKSYEMNLN